MRQELESKELKMKKLQELFKASGKEFREACYLLLGYKIDRIKKNQYQLASMYAESADDNLLFQVMYLLHNLQSQLVWYPFLWTIVNPY